jgi:hypothetical protein
LIKAAETNLAKVTEKTIVIPGHGKIGGKSEMTEYRDMLTTIHDRVAALKKAGKSLEEIAGTKPTAATTASGLPRSSPVMSYQTGLRRGLTALLRGVETLNR